MMHHVDSHKHLMTFWKIELCSEYQYLFTSPPCWTDWRKVEDWWFEECSVDWKQGTNWHRVTSQKM